MAGFEQHENQKAIPPSGDNGLNLVDLMRGTDRTHGGTEKFAANDTHLTQARSMIAKDNIDTHLNDQNSKIAGASPDEVRAMMEHNTKLMAAYQQHLAGMSDRIAKMQT